MDVRVDGKRALVTGSASGIGQAIAVALAEAGADVALNDVVSGPGLEETAARVRAAGSRALLVPADVADPAAVQSMFETVRREFGGLDLHVNNAGIQVRKPLLETSVAEWNRVLAVNLSGYFYCGTAAARLILQNERANGTGPRGAILNTCSPTWEGIPKLQAPYSVTKGGVHTFNRMLASELAPQGIRVNAIEPGATPTGLNIDIGWRRVAGPANLNPRSASGRWGWVDDMGRVAVFLLSDAAENISGADIRLDGALSLQRE